MHFKVFSILKARPHHVAASETVAHNVACKVSRVDFHSTSAMLPATISSCVHPLKQALWQIIQFIRLSEPIMFYMYSQEENLLTTKTTVKKMAANRLTSRMTWKFEEELTLIDFHKGTK